MAMKNLLLAALAAAPTIAMSPNMLHPNPYIHAHKEAQLEKSILAQLKAGSIYANSNNPKPPKQYNFSVPIDHFHNETRYEPHDDGTFDLRYWVDDSYYKPGGPVIMVGSGELTSVARVPYITQGIGKILAEATGGLTVLLEHRYYGTSYPKPDLSPKNMRFLSTEQGLADTAYFAQNIKYPGLEDHNLTASDVPYILYGGSYAGAFVAFARKLYPDVFWGAISGSGVPKVIVDWWDYTEAFRMFGPPGCVEASSKLIHITDTILASGNKDLSLKLKSFFNLEGTQDADFSYFAHWGVMAWQSTNWDPAVEDSRFARYCTSITASFPAWSSTRSLKPDVEELITAAGYASELDTLVPTMLNWIGYNRDAFANDLVGPCEDSGESCVTKCVSKNGTIDNDSIPQGMLRAWTYQTCTEWAFFVTGSGTPEDRLPLMSRFVDMDYASLWCRTVFNITSPPEIDRITKLGGYDFSYPRLAFVDGSDDPWRQAGVHRVGINKHRKSTTSEPYILVDGGVHHWDQYGPRPNASGSWLPPKVVVETQEEEIRFVKAWLEEWEEEKAKKELDAPEEENLEL